MGSRVGRSMNDIHRRHNRLRDQIRYLLGAFLLAIHML